MCLVGQAVCVGCGHCWTVSGRCVLDVCDQLRVVVRCDASGLACNIFVSILHTVEFVIVFPSRVTCIPRGRSIALRLIT